MSGWIADGRLKKQIHVLPTVEQVLEDSTHSLRRIFAALPRDHPRAGGPRIETPCMAVRTLWTSATCGTSDLAAPP